MSDWPTQQANFLQTLSSVTRARYSAALDEFTAWYRQRYTEWPDVALLTDVEVKEWREELLRQRQLAPASVNLRLAALKGLARFCGRALRTKGAPQVPPPTRVLDARELGRLLAAAEGDSWPAKRDVALLNLMARAGLRVAEVCALEVGEVTLRPRSGEVVVRLGKGAKRRQVPIGLEVRAALQAYLDVRPEQTTVPQLFVSKTLRPLAPRDVQRLVTERARDARLDGPVTPHTLRHTFGSRAVEKGLDPVMVRDLMGHTNLTTTNRYLHPDARKMQEMVEDL